MSTHRTKDRMNTRRELASCKPAHPLLEAKRQVGDIHSQKARGNLGTRNSILHQPASRLPVANQDFLRSWMVDILQEGHSQRSAPQRRHMAHLRRRSRCAPRKPSDWPQAGDKTYHPTWGECTHQAPGRLSCSDLGRAQNARPDKSVPLWSIREPEGLRPGKCTKCRASFGQGPCSLEPEWCRPGKHRPP